MPSQSRKSWLYEHVSVEWAVTLSLGLVVKRVELYAMKSAYSSIPDENLVGVRRGKYVPVHPIPFDLSTRSWKDVILSEVLQFRGNCVRPKAHSPYQTRLESWTGLR